MMLGGGRSSFVVSDASCFVVRGAMGAMWVDVDPSGVLLEPSGFNLEPLEVDLGPPRVEFDPSGGAAGPPWGSFWKVRGG